MTGFDLLQRKGAETAHRATVHYDVWRKATDDFITDARITMRYLQL